MKFGEGICYMYKDKVPIPPLAMVDDTLGISVCGVETTAMNSFLNTRTNIMNLQFGCDQCEKIHVGKKQYTDICPTLTIDSWEEKLVEGSDGNKYIEDTFSGTKIMKEVEEKKYLGDIISKNGNNKSNIKDRTNRAMGIVNKIIETISERPYGKHLFKASKLMREAMLISGLLTNSETWINITLKDREDLEKPNIILQRKILSSSGNPSKCFMQLELGLIPLKFIMMQKRKNLLNYILHENADSMIHKVYIILREDSRKGDFKALTDKDREDLEINLTDE